jgi:hypothetical protein
MTPIRFTKMSKSREPLPELHPDRHESHELARQTRRCAALTAAMLVWGIVFMGLFPLLGSNQSALILLVACLAATATLVALARGVSPVLCGNITCFIVWAACTGLALLNGGGTAPSVMWYATLPVIALLLCGQWAGVSWTLVGLLSVGGFGLAEAAGYRCQVQLTPGALRFLEYFGTGGLVACQFILVIAFIQIDRRSRRALRVVNERLQEARSQLVAVQSNLDFPIAQWAKIHQKIESLEVEVEAEESDSDVPTTP